ncbi:2304_t:CDS:2, partial [Ambispora gerdemannii]
KEFEEIVEGQREIEVTASEGKSLQENRVITVRNKSLTFDVDKEFEEIIEGKKEIEVKASGESLQENRITTVRKSLTFVGLFKGPFYRKMALICLGLSALQQLCGINGIIFYSTAIFSNAFHEKAKYATLGIGAIIVIATAVSLGLIDKKGRRPLLLSSELGMSVCSILIVFGFLFKINALVIVAG